MATVRQVRFYNYGNPNNYNGGFSDEIKVTYNTLVNGQLFGLNESVTAFQIGIQALPGTRFSLGGHANNNYIIIGQTGIYELNTKDLDISITELKFDGTSIDTINKNPNASLIVDIIYN